MRNFVMRVLCSMIFSSDRSTNWKKHVELPVFRPEIEIFFSKRFWIILFKKKNILLIRIAMRHHYLFFHFSSEHCFSMKLGIHKMRFYTWIPQVYLISKYKNYIRTIVTITMYANTWLMHSAYRIKLWIMLEYCDTSRVQLCSVNRYLTL